MSTDSIELGAYLAFSHDHALPEIVRNSAVDEIRSGSAGSTVAVYSDTVASDNWAQRQERFELSVTALIRQLDRLYESSSDLGDERWFTIALVPSSGTAGVVIQPEQLSDLARHGLAMHLNAWPGDAWTLASDELADGHRASTSNADGDE